MGPLTRDESAALAYMRLMYRRSRNGTLAVSSASRVFAVNRRRLLDVFVAHVG